MKLSKNFTLEELTRSETAKRFGMINSPTDKQVEQLLYLTLFLLQPIRNIFGRVNLTSGFRGEPLNIEIKGSKTSDHMKGKAGDIRIPVSDLKKVFNWCRENLQFGQLIYEAPGKGREPWIHISLPRIGKPNQQCMLWDGKDYSIIEGRL